MAIEILDHPSVTTGEPLKLRRKTPPAKGDRQYGRSSVSNGKRLHIQPDAGAVAWSRRFKDVYAMLVGDLDASTESQRQLVRRVTTMSIACEKIESKAAAGHDYDQQIYATLTDQLGRALQYLKQQQKEASA